MNRYLIQPCSKEALAEKTRASWMTFPCFTGISVWRFEEPPVGLDKHTSPQRAQLRSSSS